MTAQQDHVRLVSRARQHTLELCALIGELAHGSLLPVALMNALYTPRVASCRETRIRPCNFNRLAPCPADPSQMRGICVNDATLRCVIRAQSAAGLVLALLSCQGRGESGSSAGSASAAAHSTPTHSAA